MPSVGYAVAVAERLYLERVAFKPDRARLIERVSPVFNVFTQHLPVTTKNGHLERIVQSTFIIPAEHVNDVHLDEGLNGNPAAYKCAPGVIEVAEPAFDEKGYLEWAVILKLGGAFPFFKVIGHPKIAADAVAAFYLNQFVSHGLPKEGDERRLWVAKHLIPVVFQGKGTRELAFRLGNYARQMEQENPGAGLQHIYELTR